MKKIVLAAALLGLVVGGALIAYPRLFGHQAPAARAGRDGGVARVAAAPAVEPDAALAPRHFALAELAGPVEVRQGGVWRPARMGQVLSEDDGIRTGDGAHVILRSDDAAGPGPGRDELTLREGVELTLRVTRTVAEVALARGRVGAGAAGSGLHFEITAGHTRAVGSGAEGERFTVFAGDQGLVAVATQQGEVRVVAEGRQVALPAGTQTVVQPGHAPSDPVAIPPEILLSVSWPDAHPKLRKTALAGTVEPGSQVRVNGVAAPVDEHGQFTAAVELPDGTSRIAVEAEDPSGRTKVLTSGPIRLKASGPGIAVDPKDLWKHTPPDSPPR